jgi:hypothetical protein
MTNLLSETKQVLENHNKEPKDVSWVGSVDGEFAITWSDFEKIADVEYDSGFGAQEIAKDLVIVFTDGTYMNRGEYDGSEWWEYHQAPTKKSDAKPFSNVGGAGTMWDDLAGLNESQRNGANQMTKPKEVPK